MNRSRAVRLGTTTVLSIAALPTGTASAHVSIEEDEVVDGESAWIEIPADGQDSDELESPAPGVAVAADAAAGFG